MNSILLKSLLVNKNLLNDLVYFEELDSTNAYSKKNNLFDNTLVITSHQTGGTGRFGRTWRSSKNKNLTFTLIKCFKVRVDEIHLINFYSSYILFLTLKNFLEEYREKKDFDITLKWPNDILLNRRKVAGILLDVKDVKQKIKKFIIGIGLNVNQEKFSEDISLKATSLSNETKILIDPEKLLTLFINYFYNNLNLITQKEKLMKLWIQNSKIKGKQIEFKQLEDDKEKKATVISIDSDGGLKVKFNDGQIAKFFSGEIRMVY